MPRLRMDNETLTAGIDYHTLTMKDRAIDLNGAKGARESVVTGVRFIVRGGHLKLQVHTTNFNWQTGKLNLGSGSWISQNETVGICLESENRILNMFICRLPSKESSWRTQEYQQKWRVCL